MILRRGEGREELFEAFRPYAVAMAAVAAFSLVINLLMLAGPLFMMQVYDRVLTSGSVPTLVALSVLVLLLYILYGFLEFIRSRLLVRIARLGEEGLRDRAFDAVSYHAVRRSANIGSTPLQDLSVIRQFVSGSGPVAFLDMPWAPVYLLVVFMLHPVLGVFATGAVFLIVGVVILNDRLTRNLAAEAQSGAAFASLLGEESRRQVEVATALGMLPMLKEKWRVALNQAFDYQLKASDWAGLFSSASRALRMALQSGILAVGAWLAIKGEISAGALVAAAIIMSRALAPVELAVANWQPFLDFRRAVRRLSVVLSETPADHVRLSLPRPEGRVEVENLYCFAPGQEKPILAGVSFKAVPGTGLGIVGATGAGKTTLAKALVGVWPQYRGTVRLDSASLDQWDAGQLGEHIGYMPQEVELFEGTVADNIARFQSQKNSDDIVRAAKAADVHDLILKIPDGYNALLGEAGVKLSAGQRQRIGLARALYRDPAFVVLDEPNANLDAEGEAALIKAILEIRRRGGTVVVAAHRPSAMAALDLLMVLRDGRSVAFGPRDEILQGILAKPRVPASAGLSVVAKEV